MPQSTGVSLFSTMASFADAQRMAQALTASTLVPEQYRNNIPNCLIALEYAHRLNAGPFEIMQNLHVINGKPGLKAEYLASRINDSKRYSSGIKYEYEGAEGSADRSCRAYVIDTNGEKLYGVRVSIKMAKAEGWYDRKGSKWPNMPDLMLSYRAVAFFQRQHCPDIAYGVKTVDEIIDIGHEEEKSTSSGISSINDSIKAKATQSPEPQKNEPPAAAQSASGITDAEILSETFNTAPGSQTPPPPEEVI